MTAHDIALVVCATLLFLVSLATHARDLASSSSDRAALEQYLTSVASALGDS